MRFDGSIPLLRQFSCCLRDLRFVRRIGIQKRFAMRHLLRNRISQSWGQEV